MAFQPPTWWVPSLPPSPPGCRGGFEVALGGFLARSAVLGVVQSRSITAPRDEIATPPQMGKSAQWLRSSVSGRRVDQPGTCGSASSGIQALRRRGCGGVGQSKGCSTAWRIWPNHQSARLNCRARDRGGPLHRSASKPSCNCLLGMRNLCFELPTRRRGNLTEPDSTTTVASVRQATDLFGYASTFLVCKLGPSVAVSK